MTLLIQPQQEASGRYEEDLRSELAGGGGVRISRPKHYMFALYIHVRSHRKFHSVRFPLPILL